MLNTGNHTLSADKIGIFCQKWYIRELILFGSALCDDIEAEDTIEFLVSFEDYARTDLFHLLEMTKELEEIAGCKVKLLSRKFVETHPDYSIHQKNLVFQEVVYP